jgi:hypothetical protein
MKIQFKSKMQAVYNMDDTVAYQYVAVPTFKRSHVDMNAARNHPKYGSYANSDMFPGMLARIRKDLIQGSLGIRMDRLPDNVTVDTSGFLANVTIDVA